MADLKITVIQSELHWENIDENLGMFSEKISSIKVETDLIVLPEMFSTGFSMQPELLAEKMDGETVTWMKKISHQKNIILTGSIIIEDNGKYYNRLIWMLPNGTFGFYDKRHLFAFANEDQYYKPGSKRLIASVKGWRINLQICYDLRFPVWARQQAYKDNNEIMAQEYDLLIYTANWPERRNLAWKTLLQARAIENQCYVIGVNRVGNDGNNIYHSGDSTVINAMGEILYHKAHDEDVFTITLQKEDLDLIRNKFQFLRDADQFMIAND